MSSYWNSSFVQSRNQDIYSQNFTPVSIGFQAIECMGSPRTGSASSEHSSSYQPSGLQYSQPLQYPTQFQARIPFQVPQYSYDSYQPQTQVLDQSQYYVQPPTVPVYSLQASMASRTPTRPQRSRLRPVRTRQVAFRDFVRYFKGQHQQHQRQALDTILASDWLANDEMEPIFGNRSALCDFLSAPQNDGNMRCLFDGCTKHFDRQDRAIAHIRVHLGHKPYSCDGPCGIPNCRERFASAANLRSHYQRKFEECFQCGKTTLRQNMKRHLSRCFT